MIPLAHPALVRAPDDPAAYLHSESLLRRGNFSQGWPLFIRTHTTLSWAPDFLPEWPGAHVDIRGKRILAIGEGGYGDNIYFLRWLDPLRRWGADVHYVCPPSLAPLARRQGFRALENWMGNVDIKWHDYAYFTSLLSLPAKLGVTFSNYCWRGPYIRADHVSKPDRRIGICWRAGETRSETRHRSMSPVQVLALVDSIGLSDYYPVNLTFEQTHSEMENPSLIDWNKTACAVRSCDLIISVDTGVAHLAGAMGRPTLAILPPEPAWQYPDMNTHPFYPSMRMLRSRSKDLEDAVERACAYLESL